MPNRIIKESICTSDNLNNLTADEEVFFYRLTVNCDDYGRLDARPQILRAKCFPLKIDKIKEKDVEKWIVSLVRENLIILYQVDGREYLQLVTWTDHQQVRAKKSKFPAPDEEGSQLITFDNNCNQVTTDAPVIDIRETINDNRESLNDIRTAKAVKKSQSKINYAGHVKLTDEEHQKLIDQHGEEDTAKMIEVLNNYKAASGKTYKSDYHAILNWVVERVKQETLKITTHSTGPPKSNPKNIPRGFAGLFELSQDGDDNEPTRGS
jgi:hypothetical protein